MRVLIIEDNQILSRNLSTYLISRDIFAEAAFSGKDGLFKAMTKMYDVILLDINLPEIGGLEICQRIREKWVDVDIIMLTSLWASDDITTGLDKWADDYLVKPFQYSELLSRMKAVSRRRMINKSNTLLQTRDIVIDLHRSEVKKAWVIIKLSHLEFELLKFLVQNTWKTLSRKEIFERVWWESDSDFIFSKTINVYIGYLRKKLWADLIETKKGFWFLIP